MAKLFVCQPFFFQSCAQANYHGVTGHNIQLDSSHHKPNRRGPHQRLIFIVVSIRFVVKMSTGGAVSHTFDGVKAFHRAEEAEDVRKAIRRPLIVSNLMIFPAPHSSSRPNSNLHPLC